MDEFGEVVPFIGIRVRVERIGAQLVFQFVLQTVIIGVFGGHVRLGHGYAEGGWRGEGEQEREKDEEAWAGWEEHDAGEMVGRGGQNNPSGLRTSS
jgi:hypothetical protein